MKLFALSAIIAVASGLQIKNKFDLDGSDMPRRQFAMIKNMAGDLGVPLTPELMQLRSNEEISAAIVEMALSMGKSEEEVSAALGADGKD